LPSTKVLDYLGRYDILAVACESSSSQIMKLFWGLLFYNESFLAERGGCCMEILDFDREEELRF